MMVLKGQLRFETTHEHIARDMAEGRFPGRSEPQVIVIPEAEQRMILATEADALIREAEARGMERAADMFAAMWRENDGYRIAQIRAEAAAIRSEATK